MKTWIRFPLALWVLCAAFWAAVAVDRCSAEDGAVAVVGAALSASDSSGRNSAGDERCVNINHASADELTALPGIGPAIAGRVVEFREKNGAFKRLADIDNVKGIGPATLRKLEKKICF